MAGNRVEAYSKMRLADFFSRLLKVPFDRAAAVLDANINPKDSTLRKADEEGQKLRVETKNGGVSGGSGWSMVEIPYHKTGGTYSLWVLLSPVDEALLYAYENVRSEFLIQMLGWDRESAENTDLPFFINTKGSALCKNGIDTGPFVDAVGCGDMKGGSFRTMMCDYSINHELLAVRDGERYGLSNCCFESNTNNDIVVSTLGSKYKRIRVIWQKANFISP